MATSSYTAVLVFTLSILASTYSRGIGTPVSPSSQQPSPASSSASSTSRDVEDMMYSWIIPRLISMKYAHPYKEINTEEEAEEENEKLSLNSQWYVHPNLRGKKSDASFFNFPDLYQNEFASAKQARSSPVSMEKMQEVVLPWEMKYFSPMLRG